MSEVPLYVTPHRLFERDPCLFSSLEGYLSHKKRIRNLEKDLTAWG